jgi:hypothetical protein
MKSRDKACLIFEVWKMFEEKKLIQHQALTTVVSTKVDNQ